MSSDWSKRLLHWFTSKPLLTGFLIYALMQGMVSYIAYQRYRIIQEKERRERSNQLHAVQQNFLQILKNASTAALTMAMTVDDQGRPVHFDQVGQRVMASNPDIDAVQLDPHGIVQEIFPMEGNERAVGYNILMSPENRDDALESMQTRKLYFAGPLRLQQGGFAVIARLPIFIDDKFWGFSGVLVHMDKFVRAAKLHDGAGSDYFFQLTHADPVDKKTKTFFPGPSDFEKKNAEYVEFPDTDWKLYVIPRHDDNAVYTFLPGAVIGSIFAFMIGLLVALILRKPARLQLQVLKQTRRLLNSEIKYKAIFDKATLCIAQLDMRSGGFIDANLQFCRTLGREPQQLSGLTLLDVTAPQDVDAARAAIASLAADGSISFESRYITASGASVWVSQTLSPLWSAGEKQTEFIVIAQDITPKKEADARLRESEARFKSLFENSPVALWEEDFSQVKNCLQQYPDLTCDNAAEWLANHPDVVLDCASKVRITDVNLACQKLHHANTREEMIASSLTALIDERSFQSFRGQLAAIVCGRTFLAQDTCFKDESGERHIHLQWNVVPGYESTLGRVLVATEDVTREKEAHRLISDQKQRTEDLINSVEGIVWECDAKTFRLTFMSRRVKDILGYTVEEWSADPYFWENHIHPDDLEVCVGILHMVAREKQQRDFEYRMLAKNGNIVWFRDFMTTTDDGKTMRGIMMDITAEKKSAQELHESLEMVQEQKKRLMNFSYIVSHNLRSHTANIQSIVNLLDSADSDEERNEMIGMLKNVSGSLTETMVHLNELVNIQTNESLVVEPLPLHDYIENAQKAISGQIGALDAVILNDVPENIAVNFNAAYLESILLNLLSNAMRYRHPDRKPLVMVKWWNDNGDKVLSVSDNGIGIDLDRHGSKLFGLYKTFNGNADARGIGLFMTKSQIEAMGGTIAVESQPGIGTTFTIHFR